MDATVGAGGVVEASAPQAGPGVTRALGRYALLERIGAGGFGTVWRARDERLDRDVAVKLVPGDRAGPKRRWREALAAARLSHPGIVQLYEADTDDHGAWLVSELVPGTALNTLLDEGALSDRDIARIGVSLADALDHAHAHGVIHRDVKPANVLVPEAGRPGDAPAKLTDFGVALVAGDEPLTHTGDVVGTLAYMAPEQAEGRRVTAAADLYALALVLHEAWAGTNPLRGRTPAATARLVGTRLPALGRRRRDLPPALADAVDRATDPDPARRGTLAELRRAIAHAAPALSDEPGVVAPGRLEGDSFGVALPARAVAAAGSGGLAALAMLTAPQAPGAAPGLVAGLAALLALALPRFGPLALAAAAAAWAAGQDAPGAAVLILIAAAPVPLLLPRSPALWTLPALAPLLGLAGLGAAFPALAALGRTGPRRAALALLGGWWTVLAAPLLADHPPRGWWTTVPKALAATVTAAAHDGTLALLPAWALAAAVAPLLVRSESAAWRLAATLAWALALGGAYAAAAPSVSAPVAGLALGAAVIVAAATFRATRVRRSASGPLASDIPA